MESAIQFLARIVRDGAKSKEDKAALDALVETGQLDVAPAEGEPVQDVDWTGGG